MIWQGCQEQSPDVSSGKRTSQVAWHARTRWQPEPWLAEVGGQWNQNSKGRPKEGPKEEAQEGGGGGFSKSYKLETERMSGHLHFLPLLIGIISLALSFLEGNFK